MATYLIGLKVKTYVNGDNNLVNLKKDEEHFKVKLVEEEFKLRMFENV